MTHQQIEAVRELLSAFEVDPHFAPPTLQPSALQRSLFPAHAQPPAEEQLQNQREECLRKVEVHNRSEGQKLRRLADAIRASEPRAAGAVNVLFECRKNHIFYERQKAPREPAYSADTPPSANWSTLVSRSLAPARRHASEGTGAHAYSAQGANEVFQAAASNPLDSHHHEQYAHGGKIGGERRVRINRSRSRGSLSNSGSNLHSAPHHVEQHSGSIVTASLQHRFTPPVAPIPGSSNSTSTPVTTPSTYVESPFFGMHNSTAATPSAGVLADRAFYREVKFQSPAPLSQHSQQTTSNTSTSSTHYSSPLSRLGQQQQQQQQRSLSSVHASSTHPHPALQSNTTQATQRKPILVGNIAPFGRSNNMTPHPFPPTVEQNDLCKQLCYALRGVTGIYFVKQDAAGHVRLSPTVAVTLSDYQMIEYDLRIANLYVDMRKRTEAADAQPDLILHAFLKGIDKLLDEYSGDMDVLLEHVDEPDALNLINQVVESWAYYLEEGHRLLALQAQGKLSGIRLLNQFLVTLAQHQSDALSTSLFSTTLELCVNGLCNRLEPWLLQGELTTRHEERWMIKCEEVKAGSIYSLTDDIPIFFNKQMAKMVLEIGVRWRHFNSRTAAPDDLKKVDELCAFIREGNLRRLCAHDLCLPCPQLSSIISSLHSALGGAVIRSLLSQHRLIDHLHAAREFLLLEHPRFVITLFELFHQYTAGLRERLSTEKAAVILASALEKARADDEFDHKRKELQFQLDSCFDATSSLSTSPPSSSRLELVFPLKPIYSVKGPLGEMFSETSHLYQSLFQHIWCVELMRMSMLIDAELLEDMQKASQIVPKATASIAYLLRCISTLRQACDHFVVLYRDYIHQVISMSFDGDARRVTAAEDFEGLKSIHLAYLKRIHISLFLDDKNESLHMAVMFLLGLTDECSRGVRHFANQFNEQIRPPTRQDYEKMTATQKGEQVARLKHGNAQLARQFELHFSSLTEKFKTYLETFLKGLSDVPGFSGAMQREQECAWTLADRLYSSNIRH